MNCERIQFEIEHGDTADRFCREHLAACAACQRFAAGHARLGEMLQNAPRVNAPSDFLFGVQRKIAVSGSSSATGAAWLKPAMAAGFAVVCLTAAGWVGVNLTTTRERAPLDSTANSTNVETLAPPPATTSNQPEPARPKAAKAAEIAKNDVVVNTLTPLDPQAGSPDTRSIAEDRLTAALPRAATKPEKRPANPSSVSDAGGGSKLISVSPENTRRIITPKGITARPVVREAKPEEVNRPNVVGASQLLDALGIETVADKATLRVTNIRKGSPADKAGVAKDDVVETVNGEMPSAMQPASSPEATITVRRKDQKQQITIPLLKPNN